MEFNKNDPRFYSEDLDTYPDVITQNDYHPRINRPFMITSPTGMMLPPGAKFRLNPDPNAMMSASTDSSGGVPWKWVALALTLVLLVRR